MENALMHPASSPTPAAHKVVVVEDDPAIRRSLQLLLRAHGHDVRTYSSGLDLLADSGASDAACLIADYRLDRGLDGIALLSRLRANGWRCPAILVTAFPSSTVATGAREAGFTAVFEKPLRRYALVDAIARLAGGTDTCEQRQP